MPATLAEEIISLLNVSDSLISQVTDILNKLETEIAGRITPEFVSGIINQLITSGQISVTVTPDNIVNAILNAIATGTIALDVLSFGGLDASQYPSTVQFEALRTELTGLQIGKTYIHLGSILDQGDLP